MRITQAADLEVLREQGLRSLFPDRPRIAVGMAACGRAAGAEAVLAAIAREVALHDLDIEVRETGCIGFCQHEPIVDVMCPGWPRIVYGDVDPDRAVEIVTALADRRVLPQYALCRISQEAFPVDGSVRRYATQDQPPEAGAITVQELVPFFGRQERRVLRNCGLIDPDRIEEYAAMGGYRALLKVLTSLSPDAVIEEVSRSGLRGRGGAGFPAGRKWAICRQSPGQTKYVVCNTDAYMDRSILEGNPHAVIEGMAIGAYAVGAARGYIYVRADYPLALEKLRLALQQAQEHGLLGERIFGTDFSLALSVELASGGFVCGEESSMLSSLMGQDGDPRERPPYPAQSGLFGQPTLVQNVKTWTNVPLIAARGARWFGAVGTAQSRGTAVVSLTGKVRNAGIVEVPLGTSISTLVFDIGGGIPGGRTLKAVQVGGPTGGLVPSSHVHVGLDYESLEQAGTMLGAGVLVVMDDNACMVDVARESVSFAHDESCGKCTPCREGTGRMLELLADIAEGRGREEDVEILEELATFVRDTSLCGLGTTAPNPVLSTLRYFREEYLEHIRYRRCPGMVCDKIIFTPCKFNCPVKTDVPAFIAHVAQGQYKEAFEVIRAPNPFPISCGFICHHPCEDRCRSLETGDEPLSIKAIKRFVGEHAMRAGVRPVPRPQVAQRERVAVIGAGPAGLAAAYDLARHGYRPTVFEAAKTAGGNLTLVIPEFRLPQLVVDLEVDCVRQMGVEIRTGVRVGEDVPLEDLAQEYGAVLLATGAHRSLRAGIEGEDGPGVLHSFSFLENVKLGRPVTVGRRVGVIGGGNSAIDAARTALRVGAAEVFLVYRRTREEMPAIRHEVEAGLEEGVRIAELVAPVRTIVADGRLSGLECLVVQLGDPDESGRRRPIPMPGTEFVLPLDTVILAIGEQPDLDYLPRAHGLAVTRWNTIGVDAETLATARAGFFAAGDLVTGPSTIADAIASGKLAAESVERYLRGLPLERTYDVTPASPYVPALAQGEEDLDIRRVAMPCAPVAERICNFGIVELGLSEAEARREARRCLRCDLAARDTEPRGKVLV